MANPSIISLQLAGASSVANGYATAQALAAAGNLNLNGSLVTAGVGQVPVARRFTAVSSNAGDTTQVLNIFGTNQSGAPISELLALNGTNAVQSLLDYATITKVAVSAALAGNISAGTNGVGSTPWVLDNFLAPGWYLSIAVHIISGAVNYTVEHTYDDPNTPPGFSSGNAGNLPSSMEPGSFYPPIAWPNLNLKGMVADAEAQYSNQPIMAHRLTINSGTGLVAMQSLQAGLGSP